MKIILFDMMDTLVAEPYPSSFTWLLKKKNITFDEFQSYRNQDTYIQFESGFIGEYDFYRDYYRNDLDPDILLNLPKPAKVKKSMFKQIALLKGIETFLLELFEIRKDTEPKFKVGIASNYSMWYHHFLDKFPILNESMDYLFFSCEMSHRKPGRSYYELIENTLLEQFSLSSNDIFFADDRKQNLTFPKRLGWQTHLMTDVQVLKDDVFKFIAD